MESFGSRLDRLVAGAVITAAVILGGGSLLLFVVFLFAGSFEVFPLGMTDVGAFFWDAVISMVFFLQHSGMIRKGYRDRLSASIPACYEGAIFAIFSGAVLTVVVVLWQTTDAVVYEAAGVVRWLLRLVFLLAMAGMAWGADALGSFDPLGRDAIRRRGKAQSGSPAKFKVQGPYAWVRHPLYLCTLLLIWACPDVTLDRLLFNILWSLWIVAGTLLEERDLVSVFGKEYIQYQRRVPMLIPWKGRGATQG